MPPAPITPAAMGPMVPTTVMVPTLRPIAQRRRGPLKMSPMSTMPMLIKSVAPTPCTRRRPSSSQKSWAKKQALPKAP